MKNQDVKAGGTNVRLTNFIIRGVFFISLLLYSVLMYRLFYRQTTESWGTPPTPYMSDMKAYLQTMLGQESGYDYPYPVFFWLGKFFLLFTDVNAAGALATTALNSLGVCVLAWYMVKAVREKCVGLPYEKWLALIVIPLVYSLFFISMLFAPKGVYLPGMTHKYLGVFSPNPFHNATYLAARPFAAAAFFLFVRILGYYEERTEVREFFWFGFFLLLSTMTKPSFTLVFVSAAGLLMCFRLFCRKGKNFRRSLYLGLAFVPTFIDLLYQYGGVFGESSHAGETGGIGFGFFSAWQVHMENIPFAIVLALAFPGFMLLFNLGRLKDNIVYRFAWFQLLVSLAELAFLYEKGNRFIHLNFSWGYMYGIFFVFAASLILLLQNTLLKKQKWYLLMLQWLAYGWHLCCGIIYFLYIWSGQGYDSF